MTHKVGTKLHKYSKEDFDNIRNGKFLEGISIRSQLSAYKRYLNKTTTINVKRKYSRSIMSESREEFTPNEDLMVIDDEYPDTHNIEICKKRKKFLLKNFVDVGWGSLIGTQIIVW